MSHFKMNQKPITKDDTKDEMTKICEEVIDLILSKNISIGDTLHIVCRIYATVCIATPVSKLSALAAVGDCYDFIINDITKNKTAEH